MPGPTGPTGPTTHGRPPLVALTRERLADVLADALAHSDATTGALAQLDFAGAAAYGPPDARAPWRVGPFAPEPALAFRPTGRWADPDDLGWEARSLYNPTLLEHAGVLHLFYRASPAKESLGSRIGHATLDLADLDAALAAGGPAPWVDDPANPVVRPTRDEELLGTEDPKVYRADGRFWLFWNGVYPLTDDLRAAHPSPGFPVGDVGCDVLVAVSDDLVTWEGLGPVVDRAQTRLWAKGAVLPRDEHGTAVRVGGQHLMLVSEGFDGVQHVGRSDDLRTWTFTPRTYLDPSLLPGPLHEVACAVVPGDGSLVLDVFHDDADGRFAASQVLYDLDDPFRPLEVAPGGSLAWGGLSRVRGRWTFAQGWDAAPGRRELLVYRETTDGPAPPG